MGRNSKGFVAIVVVALWSLAACGSPDDNSGADADPNAPDADPNAPDADPNAPDADPSAPDANTEGFQTLITGSWSADAGSEPYWCSRVTVTEDMYITSFRDLSPPGTHHSVLTVDPAPTEPDGQFECSPGTNESAMLFASGVGTDDFLFPPGIAVKIDAGSQLNLNLHIFNTTDSVLNGTSGTLVQTVPASEVTELAEMVFAGTFAIFIGANPEPAMVNGGCTFNQDARVLNLWPHMHQLGTHMKVTYDGGTLHDLPYSFSEQINYPIAAPGTLISAGDRLDVECTYFNTTGSVVFFGDSSEDEMCFAGFYRYPAVGSDLFCTN